MSWVSTSSAACPWKKTGASDRTDIRAAGGCSMLEGEGWRLVGRRRRQRCGGGVAGI